MARTPKARRSGSSAVSRIMVVQLGLAMRRPRDCPALWWLGAPSHRGLCRPISSPLTSGTTSGTSGCSRKAEELSTTRHPASTAPGAKSRAVWASAAKIAPAQPRNASAVSSPTGRGVSPNGIAVPADRAEASARTRGEERDRAR